MENSPIDGMTQVSASFPPDILEQVEHYQKEFKLSRSAVIVRATQRGMSSLWEDHNKYLVNKKMRGKIN